ncbi:MULTISPECIES: hypothetical protein [Acetobacter]|uniref:hypothetical protein n=1 Tax=Acetobacter TaxID=434 RepID=UPI00031389BD|nr:MULTISPECIES: hypothetical protein [Acetobacter]ATI12301.1 hypothetical protein CPF11_07440 [Acetobacter pomorum]AXC27560.1 hypothetical protein DS739_12970 [Acetobacter sp. JWB]KGB23512.1 hypothetical protein ApDm4_1906 [Acetobacter pomorum]
MIAALFCGGVKTFAILGLLNPPEGLGLNTVERVAFRAAADELMLSTESALYADTHPALHDAASIVNKREFWFWQVGFAKPVMGHAPRRQEICLAAPASMGALWLRQNLNHADLPKLPPDRNGTELDARDLLEGFRGACDHSLYEAEQDFLNGNQDFQVLPIWKDAAEAWKAVRSLGAILLLTTPPPRLEPRVISSGIADHAAA